MGTSHHSSRESPNSQGPSWLLASDSSRVTHSPASTLPVSALVHLTHTTASAANPFKLHNTSSRNVCYMPKHGDNVSCPYQTLSHSQQFSARRKEARPWEDLWRRRRLASDRANESPRRKRKRMRIMDEFKGLKARSQYTQN